MLVYFDRLLLVYRARFMLVIVAARDGFMPSWSPLVRVRLIAMTVRGQTSFGRTGVGRVIWRERVAIRVLASEPGGQGETRTLTP